MVDSRKILVTGASGFIGKRLCKVIEERGGVVYRVTRDINATNRIRIGEFDENTNWTEVLRGFDCIVHLAARVHVMNEHSQHPLGEYMRVNVMATLNLARQAASAGVRRLIFISTIKVNGEQTCPHQPFNEADTPEPVGPYAISKWEAEKGLQRIGAETKLEIVIIRPPLVYGPGVRANFRSLMMLLDYNFPLPLGGINNKRSMIALDNLVDMIIVCMDHPAAVNELFLASDGEDLSLSELLQRLGDALGKPAKMFSIPNWLFKYLLTLAGKKHIASRLFGTLQVDISKASRLLSWVPPISVNAGLKVVANDFIEAKRRDGKNPFA